MKTAAAESPTAGTAAGNVSHVRFSFPAAGSLPSVILPCLLILRESRSKAASGMLVLCLGTPWKRGATACT